MQTKMTENDGSSSLMQIRQTNAKDLDTIIEPRYMMILLEKKKESVSAGDIETYKIVFEEMCESKYFDVFVMLEKQQIIGSTK